MLACGGLAASLLGNATQYFSARQTAEQSARELGQIRERWNTERVKLQEEIEVLRQSARAAAADRAAILSELATVKQNIAVWDRELLKEELQLKLDLAKVDQDVFMNRDAEPARQVVALRKEAIAYKTKQRDALVARRSELESRLGTAR